MLLKDLILTFMDTNSYLFCCLFKTNYAAFKSLTFDCAAMLTFISL